MQKNKIIMKNENTNNINDFYELKGKNDLQ